MSTSSDAMSRLDQTFGLTLKELPFEKYTYILINQMTPTESDTNHLFLSDTELAHRGILIALKKPNFFLSHKPNRNM